MLRALRRVDYIVTHTLSATHARHTSRQTTPRAAHNDWLNKCNNLYFAVAAAWNRLHCECICTIGVCAGFECERHEFDGCLKVYTNYEKIWSWTATIAEKLHHTSPRPVIGHLVLELRARRCTWQIFANCFLDTPQVMCKRLRRLHV